MNKKLFYIYKYTVHTNEGNNTNNYYRIYMIKIMWLLNKIQIYKSALIFILIKLILLCPVLL